MKIAYETWAPGPDALATVRRADQITADYEAQGYDLTLRQLYYQFVARGWLPNTQQSYKRLGDIVNRARLAGMLDWDRITDRTRNLRRLPHWGEPAEIVQGAANQFHVDMWEGQTVRAEVWVEKEALAGVVQRAADQWDCPWFSCRGYVSQSEMWAAAQRLKQYIQDGQRVVVIHLGDHDPSGIDMTRDIQDRLAKFIYSDLAPDVGLSGPDDPESFDVDEVKWEVVDQLLGGGMVEPVQIHRIALNMDQVRQYQPPPNPAKLTDSRIESYVSKFGRQSWELDALDPATLDALISDTISELVDIDLYQERQELRDQGRTQLQAVSSRWTDVVDLVAS